MRRPAPSRRRSLNIATLMVAVGLALDRVVGDVGAILALVNLPMALAARVIAARSSRRLEFTMAQFGVYYVNILFLCLPAAWGFIIPILFMLNS